MRLSIESEALVLLREALTIEEELPDAHLGLATVLAARGESDEALRHFTRASELRPDWADPLHEKAVLQMEEGWWEAALAPLGSLIGLRGEYLLDALVYRAACLVELGRDGEARTDCMAALDVEESADMPHYLLGLIAFRGGDHKLSVDECARAIAINREQADAHYCMAQALIALGKPSDARAKLARAGDLYTNRVASIDQKIADSRQAGKPRVADRLEKERRRIVEMIAEILKQLEQT